MRTRYVIHLTELISLLLAATVAIGVNGKYSSDYEYPELQLLFKCKEELKEDEGLHDGSAGSLKSKDDSEAADDQNAPWGEASSQKMSYNKNLRPWMRKPFVDEDKDTSGKLVSSKARNENSKKSSIVEKPLNEEGKSHLSDERSRISGLSGETAVIRDGNEANNMLETRKHKKFKNALSGSSMLKPHNRKNQFSMTKGENIHVENQMDKLDQRDYFDMPNFHRRRLVHNSMNGFHKKRFTNQLKSKRKLKENIYRGSLNSPKYEENFQEYVEIENKNDGGVLNENFTIPQNRRGLNSNPNPGAIYKNEFKNIKPEKEDITITNVSLGKNSIGLTISNSSSKSEPHIQQVVTSHNIPLVSVIKSFPGSRVDRLLTGGLSEGKGPSQRLDATPSYNSINLEEKGNVTAKVGNGEEQMADGGRSRSPQGQGSHHLLAKPPVKLANTFLEKHSDEGGEVLSAEEKGSKDVKISIVSGATAASQRATIEVSTAGVGGASVQAIIKRNALESPGQLPPPVLTVHYTSPAEQFHSKRNVRFQQNLGLDDLSESKEPKLNQPQFYSMSEGKTPLDRVSSVINKLKQGILKKPNVNDDKANDSRKRSVLVTEHDQYGPGFDYYHEVNEGVGDPHYDYNEYDLRYDNFRDEPKIDMSNESINESALVPNNYEYGYYRDLPNRYPRKRKQMFMARDGGKDVEDYQDVFAHPISVDDPELQIVRGGDQEVAGRAYPTAGGGREDFFHRFSNSKQEAAIPSHYMKYPRSQLRGFERVNKNEVSEDIAKRISHSGDELKDYG